jgi:hypothetical protein
MVDQAGQTPTIFDLAEHQHITARCTMKLT